MNTTATTVVVTPFTQKTTSNRIFAVVDDLIKPGLIEQEHRHALQLATERSDAARRSNFYVG